MSIETGLNGIHVNFRNIDTYEDWPSNYEGSEETDRNIATDQQADPLYPEEQIGSEHIQSNEM